MIDKHDLPFINANVRDAETGELILPEYKIVERSGDSPRRRGGNP